MHGKAGDLASGFVREWMGNLLRSVASCLGERGWLNTFCKDKDFRRDLDRVGKSPGHSSLFAIPRAPVEFLETAGEFAASAMPRYLVRTMVHG